MTPPSSCAETPLRVGLPACQCVCWGRRWEGRGSVARRPKAPQPVPRAGRSSRPLEATREGARRGRGEKAAESGRAKMNIETRAVCSRSRRPSTRSTLLPLWCGVGSLRTGGSSSSASEQEEGPGRPNARRHEVARSEGEETREWPATPTEETRSGPQVQRSCEERSLISYRRIYVNE